MGKISDAERKAISERVRGLGLKDLQAGIPTAVGQSVTIVGTPNCWQDQSTIADTDFVTIVLLATS